MDIAPISPNAKSVPTSLPTKLFLVPVIKVTSDLLTNLYELTTWLIHSMPRDQREMHLRKRERTAAGIQPRETKLSALRRVDISNQQ